MVEDHKIHEYIEFHEIHAIHSFHFVVEAQCCGREIT
jgi:hypothetical protein